MELRNVGGFEVMMPEKAQHNKFIDKVKKVAGVMLNRRRPDSGTRATESDKHIYDRDNAELNASYKRKKRKRCT